MTTKKITKIISTENGDNYVADIEDIENRINQNSSNLETAKQELSNKCNEALSQAKAYTDQEKANFVKKSGDKLTGAQFVRNVDNSSLQFYGGTTWGRSASIHLTGNKSDLPCAVSLYCHNPTSEAESDFNRFLIQYNKIPTWNGNPIEIINSLGPNYIRYESGRQIVWNSYVAHSKKETINFPMPFKYPPIMTVTLDGNVNSDSAVNFIGYAHPTTTNFISFTNWGGAMVLMYIAMGYWK